MMWVVGCSVGCDVRRTVLVVGSEVIFSFAVVVRSSVDGLVVEAASCLTVVKCGTVVVLEPV